ncbi:hypothetical protein ACF08M_08035 [Streptomyces sp. NPDC015032]|uniref:hypothetical protein n=1 Tax=Streptomyces sp. NPDC015032 TaxID=3364937 RepID=UPI003702B287
MPAGQSGHRPAADEFTGGGAAERRWRCTHVHVLDEEAAADFLPAERLSGCRCDLDAVETESSKAVKLPLIRLSVVRWAAS